MDVKKGDIIICKKEFTLANNNYLINQNYIIVGDCFIYDKRVLTIKLKGVKGLYNIYESTLNANFENKWDKRKRIIDEL